LVNCVKSCEILARQTRYDATKHSFTLNQLTIGAARIYYDQPSMDAINPLLCPNCGEALANLAGTQRFACPSCGRDLYLLSPKKVVIADPLSDFRAPEHQAARDGADAPIAKITNRQNELSPRRKQRIAELAHERVAQEQISTLQARRLGIWSIVLGILLLGLGAVRQIYLQDDWLAVAIIVFGGILLCGGVFLGIRFYFDARTLTEIEKNFEDKVNR
jgi:rRNA maturation protein Nop10